MGRVRRRPQTGSISFSCRLARGLPRPAARQRHGRALDERARGRQLPPAITRTRSCALAHVARSRDVGPRYVSDVARANLGPRYSGDVTPGRGTQATWHGPRARGLGTRATWHAANLGPWYASDVARPGGGPAGARASFRRQKAKGGLSSNRARSCGRSGASSERTLALDSARPPFTFRHPNLAPMGRRSASPRAGPPPALKVRPVLPNIRTPHLRGSRPTRRCRRASSSRPAPPCTAAHPPIPEDRSRFQARHRSAPETAPLHTHLSRKTGPAFRPDTGPHRETARRPPTCPGRQVSLSGPGWVRLLGWPTVRPFSAAGPCRKVKGGLAESSGRPCPLEAPSFRTTATCLRTDPPSLSGF